MSGPEAGLADPHPPLTTTEFHPNESRESKGLPEVESTAALPYLPKRERVQRRDWLRRSLAMKVEGQASPAISGEDAVEVGIAGTRSGRRSASLQHVQSTDGSSPTNNVR